MTLLQILPPAGCLLAAGILAAAPVRFCVRNETPQRWTLVPLQAGPEGRLRRGGELAGEGEPFTPVQGGRIPVPGNQGVELTWDDTSHPGGNLAFALLDCNGASRGYEVLTFTWSPQDGVLAEERALRPKGRADNPIGVWKGDTYHIVKHYHRSTGSWAFPKEPPAAEPGSGGQAPAGAGESKQDRGGTKRGREDEPGPGQRPAKRARLDPGPQLVVRNASGHEWGFSAPGLEAKVEVGWGAPARKRKRGPLPSPADPRAFDIPDGETARFFLADPSAPFSVGFELVSQDPFRAAPHAVPFDWEVDPTAAWGSRARWRPGAASFSCWLEGDRCIVLGEPKG